MSKETVEEVKVISPGAMLKAAREKQGLSREEVADQLHLRFTIIKDLEEDQYATDISATFTKGYLKLYSKLLGIDEEQVLAAYQQLGTQEKEPAKLQSFSQKVARQASDQRLMWVTYFVLILVLAGVIAWWIQQDDTSLSNFIDRNVSAATQSNEAVNSAANTTAANTTAANNSAVNNTPATNNDQQSATVPADTTASQSSAFPPANSSTSDTSFSDTSSDTSSQQAEATNDSSENTQNSDQANVPADTQSANTQVSSQPGNDSQDPVAEPVSNSSDSSPDEAQASTQTNTQSKTSPALETEAGVFATLETDSGQADNLSGQSSSQTGELSSQTAISEPAAQNDNVNQIPNDAEPALNLPLADPVELVFTFSGDCWMKLTDATGEDVAYGIKQAGRIMPVSGVPPFEVVLGAPESVQISYAGEPIDMARFRPGYTARFQLPLSE